MLERLTNPEELNIHDLNETVAETGRRGFDIERDVLPSDWEELQQAFEGNMRNEWARSVNAVAQIGITEAALGRIPTIEQRSIQFLYSKMSEYKRTGTDQANYGLAIANFLSTIGKGDYIARFLEDQKNLQLAEAQARGSLRGGNTDDTLLYTYLADLGKSPELSDETITLFNKKLAEYRGMGQIGGYGFATTAYTMKKLGLPVQLSQDNWGAMHTMLGEIRRMTDWKSFAVTLRCMQALAETERSEEQTLPQLPEERRF